MRIRSFIDGLVAVALAFAAPVAAQTVRAGNGSAAAPSITFNSNLGLGAFRVGPDSLAFAGGSSKRLLLLSGLDTTATFKGRVFAPAFAASVPTYSFVGTTNAGMTFTAGNVVLANGGATVFQVASTQVLTAVGGGVSNPSYSFNGTTNLGMYRPAGDTVAFANAGVRSLSVAGGANTTLLGGAGDMTLLAGTGNSRTLTLQTTTSAGTAKNTLVLGADSSAAFLGNIRSGTGGNNAGVVAMRLNGGSASGGGSYLSFQRDGTVTSSIGTASAFVGGTSSDMVLYAESGNAVRLYTNAALSLTASGGAAATLTGGAGNMTIQAGTGNNRDIALSVTSGTGVVRNNFLMRDSATFIGRQGTLDWRVGAGGGLFPMTTDVYNIGSSTERVRYINFYDQTFAYNFAGASTPSYSFGGDGNLGIYRVGADTLGVAAAGRVAAVVRDSQILVIPAGVGSAKAGLAFLGDDNTGITGNGADTLGFVTGGTRRAYVSSAGINLPSGQLKIADGTAASPSLCFCANTLGFYRIGQDTIGVSTGSTRTLSITGTGAAAIAGGAGNMTILAGTGNSRTMTLQTTSSGGVAKNNLVLSPGDTGVTVLGVATVGTRVNLSSNGTSALPALRFSGSGGQGLYAVTGGIAVTDATNDLLTVGTASAFTSPVVITTAGSDTLRTATKVVASALTAAAGTPNTVCINAATKEITENAATSCVVSAARFKTGIEPLNPVVATASVMAMRPSQWTYIDGQRRAVGLIADNVDSIDTRLGFRNADGQINSYDQAGVLGLLTATVQQMRRELDSLKAVRDTPTVRRDTLVLPQYLTINQHARAVLRMNSARDTVWVAPGVTVVRDTTLRRQ